MTVLVTYASARGSTREVAQSIAAALREQRLDVDLRPAAAVDTVAGYDAVVVGVALYLGHAHVDARRLIRRLRNQLATLPVAVFALGPRTDAPEDVAESRRQLEHDLRKVPEVEPFSVAVFGGVVDPTQLRFPLNRIPASDARDWDAIGAWAREVADALPREAVDGPLAAIR